MNQVRNDRHCLDPFAEDSSDDEYAEESSHAAHMLEEGEEAQIDAARVQPEPYILKLKELPSARHLILSSQPAISPLLLSVTSTQNDGVILDGELQVGRVCSASEYVFVSLLPGLRPEHCHSLACTLLETATFRSIALYTAAPQAASEDHPATLCTTHTGNKSTLQVPVFLQGIEASVLTLAQETGLEATAFVFDQDPGLAVERPAVQS